MSNETKKVKAPYNFIPFSNKVIARYENIEDLPEHGHFNPKLKSGEINFTIKAETPIFIADSQNNFIKSASGKYHIPGSTLKGLIRQNMHILGFGLMCEKDDIDDNEIYFRVVAASSSSNESALKTHYKNVLDTQPIGKGKNSITVPHNVKYGYLSFDGKTYSIRKIEKVLRVRRSDLENAGFDETTIAKTEKVYFVDDGKFVTKICKNNKERDLKEGTLLWTGKPIGKGNNLYVFPYTFDGEEIEVPNEDIISYKMDFKMRENVLIGNKQFWNLPKVHEEKPVFYIEYNGKVYLGMSQFLRIGHKYSVTRGLPDSHTRNQNCLFLDYPSAILGFSSENSSYRSRVSFLNAEVVGNAKQENEISLTLLGPKPSYYAGYIIDGKNYSDEDFKLRGYKQYWLKDILKSVSDKEKVLSTIKPLPRGTEFKGTIRFKNLHEDELGLLLWCIGLDENSYQSIGMGKPYGYGRVKISIDSLSEYNSDMYTLSGLTDKLEEKSSEDVVKTYIGKYENYVAEKLKPPKKNDISKFMPRNREEIKDFFYMHNEIRKDNDNVSYMPLKDYQNTQGILETVAKHREEREKSADTKEASKQSLEELLAGKFNVSKRGGKR